MQQMKRHDKFEYSVTFSLVCPRSWQKFCKNVCREFLLGRMSDAWARETKGQYFRRYKTDPCYSYILSA